MKKLPSYLVYIAALLVMGSIGCTELHEAAEGSIDDNKIRYTGPSPYAPPLSVQYENITYLLMEDFINDIFWPITDLFYDKNAGTVYDPSQYDLKNTAFAPSFWGSPKTPAKGSPKISLLLSEGLEYVGKGGKEKNGTTVTRTRLNYLEVPVMVNYYARIGKSQSAYHVGLGPWVSYALSGKFKTTGQNDVAVTFGSTGDFARMDYGAGFKAGVRFNKKWDVSLGYDLGMRNLLGTQGAINDGDKAKTRNISLSLGYWFK